MHNNLVEIRQGSALMRFVKNPDGTYNPPRGQALKISQSSGCFKLKNRALRGVSP